MIILSDTAAEQTFTIIPRFKTSGSLDFTFTNETQNKVSNTFAYAGTYANGVLTINTTFSPVLKLNTFYSITVFSGLELLWRGRAFVTDQTELPKYSINENKFDEYDGNNNEFIVL